MDPNWQKRYAEEQAKMVAPIIKVTAVTHTLLAMHHDATASSRPQARTEARNADLESSSNWRWTSTTHEGLKKTDPDKKETKIIDRRLPESF